MNALTTSVIKYILDVYPQKNDLSASRLAKIVYLSDWKSALVHNKQITDTDWHFNHFGPYVDDFIKMAKQDDDIKVIQTRNFFGKNKRLLKLSEKSRLNHDLPIETKKIIDFVIKQTEKKNYQQFINLVYSTYPVMSSSKYNNLNLVDQAAIYKMM